MNSVELPDPGFDLQSITPFLEGRLAAATRLAKLCGAITLKYFQQPGVDVIRKGDDSPVTIADREGEQAIRRVLAELYPDDAILGEEFGEQAGTSEYQWILDPIDGTKSFIFRRTTLFDFGGNRSKQGVLGRRYLYSSTQRDGFRSTRKRLLA